jgi:hypothetical protein
MRALAILVSTISLVLSAVLVVPRLPFSSAIPIADAGKLDDARAARFKKSGAKPEDHVPVPLGENQAPVYPAMNVRGVYLTVGSMLNSKKVEDTLNNLQASKGNAIIFDVKGSRVFFDTTSPITKELGLRNTSVYDLAAEIKKIHDRGFYALGRFIAIKDAGITAKRPDTQVKHPTNGAVLAEGWVDPSNQLAIDYNAEVMCDLAKSGIDEVNMDYIRFSTATFGALRVYTGAQKADKLEPFFKKMREMINLCGPNTKLGISTYAILGWDYNINMETLGQDVVRFAPYVDVISPMAYPATFTSEGYWNPAKHGNSRMYWLVKRTLTGYAEKLGPMEAKKLRPWIQGYSVDKQDVLDEIRAVRDAGLCGFTVWNAGNNYTQTYAAMAAAGPWPAQCGQ